MKVVIDELINQYVDMVLQIAYQNIYNKPDSEDLTQYVFIKFMKNIDSLKAKEQYKMLKAEDNEDSKFY